MVVLRAASAAAAAQREAQTPATMSMPFVPCYDIVL